MYLATGEGWLYLAALLTTSNRLVDGYEDDGNTGLRCITKKSLD